MHTSKMKPQRLGNRLIHLACACLLLGLASSSFGAAFLQRISYTPPSSPTNYFDTLEIYMDSSPPETFTNGTFANFDDPSWAQTLIDRRHVLAIGVSPRLTTPPATASVAIPLSFDVAYNSTDGIMTFDLLAWDGGPRGTLVDASRITLDGLGGYTSAPLTASQVNLGGTPLKFVKAAPISIPLSGRGVPYANTITVNNLSTKVSKVNVELRGLTHTSVGDIACLLVGPQGQKCLFMADVGGVLATKNTHLTFDDSVTASIVATVPLKNGVFKPTSLGTRVPFPAPAPAGPYSTSLSVFNGTLPNGVWTLYVLDDKNLNQGTIARGWALSIE